MVGEMRKDGECGGVHGDGHGEMVELELVVEWW